MTVKMADFGLSQATRFYKETKAETKLPIRWLAPESLGQNIFSSKTDVWSYGVLMNEASIYTNGETPYPSLSLQDVRTLVTRSGGRLAAPAIMQPGVAALMKKCFEENPNERWLAPESLGQNIFSSKTDVWSYGVLMNEASLAAFSFSFALMKHFAAYASPKIYTNGETPYPSLSLQDVRTLVTRSGGRLAAPAIMQPGVAALMKKCFEENPNERPTFLELKLKLRKEYAALTKKPGGLISFFKRK
ncbi:Tyrosine kinase receptor Cad96Ca [Toxocara canis]|uniref:Tyrosine kinase receptor Cad96Ca n=1 Tax=Toxocara canis TaxID=6265 RepID=A0A0B2W3F4_TOXCA|nr:Tyrosine kinase receptor Cad96Ca [Toxocara canis]